MVRRQAAAVLLQATAEALTAITAVRHQATAEAAILTVVRLQAIAVLPQAVAVRHQATAEAAIQEVVRAAAIRVAAIQAEAVQAQAAATVDQVIQAAATVDQVIQAAATAVRAAAIAVLLQATAEAATAEVRTDNPRHFQKGGMFMTEMLFRLFYT